MCVFFHANNMTNYIIDILLLTSDLNSLAIIIGNDNQCEKPKSDMKKNENINIVSEIYLIQRFIYDIAYINKFICSLLL